MFEKILTFFCVLNHGMFGANQYDRIEKNMLEYIVHNKNKAPRPMGNSSLKDVIFIIAKNNNQLSEKTIKHLCNNNKYPNLHYTPLLIAVRRRNISQVKVFLALGADVHDLENHDNEESPIIKAILMNDEEIATALIAVANLPKIGIAINKAFVNFEESVTKLNRDEFRRAFRIKQAAQERYDKLSGTSSTPLLNRASKKLKAQEDKHCCTLL